MTISLVLNQMNSLLRELSNIDFGYPIGINSVNSVAQPESVPNQISAAGECATKWLMPIYTIFDGLSFPDVHIGYFIKPLNRVISFNKSSEPDTVVFDGDIPVLPIGSTGGGDLFVIRCDSGSVMLLPPGPLKDGRYDGTNRDVKEVAKSVPEFLELLLVDLKSFINDDKQHVYIA